MQIDDVMVQKGSDKVVLDVRIRNDDSVVANITRAEIEVLSRMAAAAPYKPSAAYDMLLTGDHNEVAVAHALESGEVDNFLIRIGFPPFNSSCFFEAVLTLRYNGDQTVGSERFSFDSCF